MRGGWAEPVVIAMIGAGLMNWFVRAGVGVWRRWNAQSRSGQSSNALNQADLSILVVAKARDELAEDLARSRQYREEDRAAFAEERRVWLSKEARMRSEIDELERRLREVLRDLATFRSRNGMADDEDPTLPPAPPT